MLTRGKNIKFLTFSFTSFDAILNLSDDFVSISYRREWERKNIARSRERIWLNSSCLLWRNKKLLEPMMLEMSFTHPERAFRLDIYVFFIRSLDSCKHFSRLSLPYSSEACKQRWNIGWNVKHVFSICSSNFQTWLWISQYIMKINIFHIYDAEHNTISNSKFSRCGVIQKLCGQFNKL